MPSYQQLTIVGHAGRDPEVRYMPNGEAVVNFSVAVSEKWKAKDGSPKEHTEWFSVVAYKQTAEFTGKFLKKGNLVFVQGKVRTRVWKDKEGQERKTTEFLADKVMILEKRQEEKEIGQSGQSGQAKSSDKFADMEDDIPF